ncbi:MAG: hypothetical protein NTV51_19430 [Verrucomicrobia bacterium]|nr:hypothetical protein [Verrucomicrobiota bacterium]
MKLPRLPVRGCFALLGLLVAPQAPAQPPVNIGSRLELFVDDALVARLQGAELRLHEPVKAPRPKSPLPERHMMTVIKDGDLYRAWYRSTDPSYHGETSTGHPGETVHYAESRDGHEWTFPLLRLHLVGGTLENNVILAGQPPFLTNFMPFLDTRPGVDPAERYKALAGYPGAGDKRGQARPGMGLFAFVSPDGIRWTKRAEAIPFRNEWRHAFDSPNVSFWSEAEQGYVCYFRTWTAEGRLRSVSRATSPDFVTWSDPVDLRPNLPGEHLYTTMTHPYFRAPHIYIATPTRYVPGRGDAPTSDAKDANLTDVLFMSSRAGATHYDRPFTEAFLRPGLDPARWHNRGNYVALNVLPTGPAEMSIYHRSGDRYVLRTDGFISVHTGAREGELLTRPIVFAGRELVLNVSTSAAGGVRAEIRKAGGEPIPGFTLAECTPVFGDALERPLHWKGGGLAALAGQPVQLRFVMTECDLYAYRFR